MTSNRGPFLLSIIALGAVGGLLGGFNFHWSREASFPLYGILIDICAIPALIYMALYVRRLKAVSTDEFAVAKKRFAAQTGFVIGFLLFAVSGVIPILFPQAYHGFVGTMADAQEGFIMGRVFGMLPFIIGLLIGQAAAWAKYR